MRIGLERLFVEAMGGTEPPRQRPSSRPIDSFSFDSGWEDDGDLVSKLLASRVQATPSQATDWARNRKQAVDGPVGDDMHMSLIRARRGRLRS